jgi:hypothetical protein
MQWAVEVDKGVTLDRVIVGGYHGQQVAGVKAPTLYCTYEYGDRTGEDRNYFYAYKQGGKEYDAMIARLNGMTGLEVKSFQGLYQPAGAFVIGPKD